MTSQPAAPRVLIDTSAWIPALRQQRHGTKSPIQERVDELLATDRAATTGILRMELLVGARDASAREQLRSLLLGLHGLTTLDEDWDAAGQLGQQLRLAGVVVQGTDLIIATIAIRAGVVLLYRDTDFELIAQHTNLQTERHP